MGAHKINTDDLIRKLDEIPALPGIIHELNRIINDPMSSAIEVEDILSQDIGLTTKVLQLANSAHYGIPGGVSSLDRAISTIGFGAINQMVLSSSIIKILYVSGPSAFDINEFWKHSVAVAIAGEVIAKQVRYKNPAELFTIGLLHDIGKLALYITDQETLLFILATAEKNKKTYYETEIQLDLTPHTKLGQLLGKKWKLPAQIQTALLYHHEKDPLDRGELGQDIQRLVDVVYLANLLVHALKFGSSGYTCITGAPGDLLDRLVINSKSDLATLTVKIKASLDKASDFIQMVSQP